MPLFEFVCSECGQPFEELVRSSNAISEVSCPECGSRKISKKISTFASRLNNGVRSSGFSAASCTPGGV